jgi:hypothetical protein
MYTLATLHYLRQHLGLEASDTADDVRLLAALTAATAEIERAVERRFSPRYAALRHSVTHSVELLLDADLLELVSLTNGDGTLINPAEVVLLPSEVPAGVLRLINSTFTWEETPLNAVTVTGLWGWHDRWAAAWRASGDTVQNNPLTASAVSLTVSDADGADNTGETPRFQVGQLLKIEAEYLWVLAVNLTTNTLTVERGANGTTAASHVQTTPIFIYQPPSDIVALVLRRAAWFYREADQPDLPPENVDIPLASLRRSGVKA